MRFPVASIRPGCRYAWSGPSLLILEPDGSAGGQPLTGFFFRHARFLKDIRLEVRGEVPHLCSVAEVAPAELEFTYIHPEVDGGGGGGSGSGGLTSDSGILHRAIDLRLHYRVHPASVAMTLRMANRWHESVELDVAWFFSADYASIDDAQFNRHAQAAAVQVHSSKTGLVYRYLHPDLPFETHVGSDDAVWCFRDHGANARVTLPRQEVVELVLTVRAHDPLQSLNEPDERRREERTRAWRSSVVELHAPGETPLVEITSAALDDMASLALLEGPEEEWLVPGAGVPLYLTVWGRDGLTAAWQAGLFDCGEMLASVVTYLARLQGTRVDPSRDEEPGRILNQGKTDPLARTGETPFARYYADVASPFMFLIGLGYHHALTGDKAFLDRHWASALRVLEWAGEHGDRDGDGYIEYLTSAPAGPRHQAWKDSENAIVYHDGTQVEPPIASCEIQGYYHVALQMMAGLALVRGERSHSFRLWRQAAELKTRFNRDFWLEEEGFIASGLDAEKRPIRALTSNAAQCLPTGIVNDAHVPRLVRRIFEPDLFSGWGLRTLSSSNPAYQPLDYHLGSVWPVENASILFGLRRYGFEDRAHQLARAMYDLARLWPAGRTPECVGGYARDECAHPGAYPRANAPQTWNQSVWPLLIQSLLGMVPFAPLNLLVVDPILPAWLPELTLKRLRVGNARVSLHFWRERDGSSRFEVLEQEGSLRVVRQPWIESFSADIWDRLGGLVEIVRSH